MLRALKAVQEGNVSINCAATERGTPKMTLKNQTPMNAVSAMGLTLRMLTQWLWWTTNGSM